MGNNFGFHSYAGRCDAGIGLILKGDGNGSFKSLNVNKSGFYVSGNAKSFVPIRSTKNEHLFLVGNNNDFMQVFLLNK